MAVNVSLWQVATSGLLGKWPLCYIDVTTAVKLSACLSDV